MSHRVAITGEGLSAEIDPLGAQLFALRDAEGRDLLWDGDPAFWTGRAPILFPIVGCLKGGRYRLGSQTYVLPQHGFARHRRFEVVETAADRAVCRLSDDAETHAVYPFAFQLEMTFAIEGARLIMTAGVHNPGEEPLPASFGFHPALRWPLPYGQPREAHALRFDQPEPAPVRRIDAQALVRAEPQPTPIQGRDLALRDDLFEAGAIILDRLESRGLSYGAEEGPRLRIDFPYTPRLGLWTKPGAGYVCIEPWCGMADPEGFDGDFRRKPGVFEVEPGGTKTIAMSIEVEGVSS